MSQAREWIKSTIQFSVMEFSSLQPTNSHFPEVVRIFLLLLLVFFKDKADCW